MDHSSSGSNDKKWAMTHIKRNTGRRATQQDNSCVQSQAQETATAPEACYLLGTFLPWVKHFRYVDFRDLDSSPFLVQVVACRLEDLGPVRFDAGVGIARFRINALN